VFIQTLKPPVAGQDFSFSIAGASGVTCIEVHVNDRRILRFIDNRLLCHAAAHVPADAAGQTLAVAASDEKGNCRNLEYQISDADTERRSTPVSARHHPRGNMRFRMVG
jgi:hypothetical protein